MVAYKAPDFTERAAAARAAKQRAVELLRDKPQADTATIAARQAAREAKEAAEAERRAARRAAADQAKAEKKAAAAPPVVEKVAPQKAPVVVPTAAELKAARDARYAARKARK